MEFLTRRIWAVLGLTALFVLGGLYYVAQIARQGLLHDLSAWSAQERSRGLLAQAEVAPAQGLWFRPVVVLRGAHLHAGDAVIPGGLDLRADEIDLHLDIGNPGTVVATLRGVAQIGLADWPAQSVIADRLTLTAHILSNGKLASLVIDGKNLHPPAGEGLGAGILTGTLTLDDQNAHLALSTEAVTLPPLPQIDQFGLGRHISDFTFDGALHVWPTHEGDAHTRADLWRVAGGRITLDSVMLGWGQLGVTGHGDLGLDDALAADGRLHLDVRGAAPLLTSLGGPYALAGALLDNNDQPLPLDLRAKHGKLLLNRIEIGKVPELPW